MTQRIQKVHFMGDEIKLLKNTPKDPKTGLPEARLEPPLLSSGSWSFCRHQLSLGNNYFYKCKGDAALVPSSSVSAAYCP